MGFLTAQVYLHADGLTMLVQRSCPNIDMRRASTMRDEQSLRNRSGVTRVAEISNDGAQTEGWCCSPHYKDP
jgi:hypothetical protein